MIDFLLDTGILVRHLRNDPGYIALTSHLSSKGVLSIASFTRFEILRGMRDYEQERTYDLLDSMVSFPMNDQVADLAGKLIRVWRKQGITLGDGDVIIAATAISQELVFVTSNARHFPMPELTVWQADEDGNVSIYEH